MNFVLKINGEYFEEYLCRKHNKWNQIGDEMDCCTQELEELLCLNG